MAGYSARHLVWRASWVWIGAAALSAVCSTGAVAQTSPDVIFATPFAPGEQPKVAQFYYNERAVGEGRESFVEILNRVRKIPEGASIVWGPDYARCGSCSGSEPDCLPKHLHPELWTELEKIARERNLTISSSYPEPFVMPNHHLPGVEFPEAIVGGDALGAEKFDAVLDWEVGERSKRTRPPEGVEFSYGRLHRFRSMGRPIAEFDRAVLLDRLPQQSRVLLRITLRNRNALNAEDPKAIDALTKVIDEGLNQFVRQHARLVDLKVTAIVPEVLVAPLKQRIADERRRIQAGNSGELSIQLENFRGPDTPHREVFYHANGSFLGRGEEGFSNLLERVESLSPGAKVIIPRYQLTGRAAFENHSSEELASKNAKLRNMVPFGGMNKVRLDRLIVARKLVAEYWETEPGSEPGTVLDWSLGSGEANDFVRHGRIIHHDEPVAIRGARLEWVRYDAHLTGDRRQVESKAVYTLNGVELGAGMDGFEAALQRLSQLPEGATIQVRVCLRTKGPFLCPLLYEGERHFERSGFEPYFGMLDLLLDRAKQRKWQIEWLPDEGKPCGNCELKR